ncbi:MAG: hypothetical protein KGJ13_08040 [Patescibacteria group bacterium]|nr:hypothetical protein [Patescibacteria group bacterium]
MAKTPSLAVPTPPAPPAPPQPPAAPAPKAKKEKPAPVPAPTAAPTVPPAAAPVVPAASGAPTNLQEALARIDQLEKALAGNAARQLQAEQRLKAIEEEVSLPIEVRSQRLADKAFEGPKVFFVTRPDNPGLSIRAHDEHQARARYDHHCGIRGSEHPATVTEVDEAPEPTPAFGPKKKK